MHKPTENPTVGMLLGAANHMLWKSVNRSFQQIGLTPGQPPILRYLSNHDGCIQKELAQHNHHEAASISAILDSLEKNGMVERRKDEKDKRVWRIYRTEKGAAAEKAVGEIFHTMDMIMTESLTAEEAASLSGLLKKVTQSLLDYEQKNFQETGKEKSDEKTPPLH